MEVTLPTSSCQEGNSTLNNSANTHCLRLPVLFKTCTEIMCSIEISKPTISCADQTVTSKLQISDFPSSYQSSKCLETLWKELQTGSLLRSQGVCSTQKRSTSGHLVALPTSWPQERLHSTSLHLTRAPYFLQFKRKKFPLLIQIAGLQTSQISLISVSRKTLKSAGTSTSFSSIHS